MFEELGRLSTLLLLLQQKPGEEAFRTTIRNAIIYLVNQHSGYCFPFMTGTPST
jgi:hypothetical protein